ncbi:MAG: hypothetical protein M1827_005655 [Pycnora praestabilis]|nr:MAG: hypothetical protein M1827_005655 [Pycnora praestabilis]
MSDLKYGPSSPPAPYAPNAYAQDNVAPTYPQQPMAQSPPPQQGYVAPQQQPVYQSHVGATTSGGVEYNGPVRDWENSFWDCCAPTNICCMAYWCPCILYGKTHARLDDPTLSNYSACNGSCIGWFALATCGFQWVLQMINRGDVRARYKLDGSGAGDCLRSYCCPCCVLVQEEKEVLLKTQGGVAHSTQPQGYQKTEGGMNYA